MLEYLQSHKDRIYDKDFSLVFYSEEVIDLLNVEYASKVFKFLAHEYFRVDHIYDTITPDFMQAIMAYIAYNRIEISKSIKLINHIKDKYNCEITLSKPLSSKVNLEIKCEKFSYVIIINFNEVIKYTDDKRYDIKHSYNVSSCEFMNYPCYPIQIRGGSDDVFSGCFSLLYKEV